MNGWSEEASGAIKTSPLPLCGRGSGDRNSVAQGNGDPFLCNLSITFETLQKTFSVNHILLVLLQSLLVGLPFIWEGAATWGQAPSLMLWEDSKRTEGRAYRCWRNWSLLFQSVKKFKRLNCVLAGAAQNTAQTSSLGNSGNVCDQSVMQPAILQADGESHSLLLHSMWQNYS